MDTGMEEREPVDSEGHMLDAIPPVTPRMFAEVDAETSCNLESFVSEQDFIPTSPTSPMSIEGAEGILQDSAAVESPSVLGAPSPEDTDMYDNGYSDIDSDEEDLEQFVSDCRAIAKRAGHERGRWPSTARARIIACGVANGMEDHARCPEAAQAGCRALWRVAGSLNAGKHRSASAVVHVAGFEVIVEALRTHEECPGVQLFGLRALATMAFGHREEACRAGAIEAAVAGMRAHAGEQPVQEAGCSALMQLAHDPSSRLRAGEAGGIEAAVAALQANPTHSSIQSVGFWALTSITAADTRNIQLAGAAGSVEAALTALRSARSARSGAKVAACWSLWNLSSDAGLRSAAAAGGAVEVVVGLLKALPRRARVQEAGCNALTALVAEDAGHRDRAGDAGGVEAAVGAAQEHPTRAAVQEAAWQAVRSLTFSHPLNRRRAAGAGAAEALASSLRAFPADAALQEAGLRALVNLTAGNSYLNCAAACAAGCVELVVLALRLHADDRAVQRAGCDALANLTATTEGNRRAAAAEAVEVVVGALARHGPADAEAAQAICWALTQLTSNAFSRMLAGSLGALEWTVRAMRAHPAHPGVQISGCNALWSLAALFAGAGPDGDLHVRRASGLEAGSGERSGRGSLEAAAAALGADVSAKLSLRTRRSGSGGAPSGAPGAALLPTPRASGAAPLTPRQRVSSSSATAEGCWPDEGDADGPVDRVSGVREGFVRRVQSTLDAAAAADGCSTPRGGGGGGGGGSGPSAPRAAGSLRKLSGLSGSETPRGGGGGGPPTPRGGSVRSNGSSRALDVQGLLQQLQGEGAGGWGMAAAQRCVVETLEEAMRAHAASVDVRRAAQGALRLMALCAAVQQHREAEGSDWGGQPVSAAAVAAIATTGGGGGSGAGGESFRGTRKGLAGVHGSGGGGAAVGASSDSLPVTTEGGGDDEATGPSSPQPRGAAGIVAARMSVFR